MKSLKDKWKFHSDGTIKGNWPDDVWLIIDKCWPDEAYVELTVKDSNTVIQGMRGIHREITRH